MQNRMKTAGFQFSMEGCKKYGVVLCRFVALKLIVRCALRLLLRVDGKQSDTESEHTMHNYVDRYDLV